MYKVRFPFDCRVGGATTIEPDAAGAVSNTGPGPVAAGIDAGGQGVGGCDVRTAPDA